MIFAAAAALASVVGFTALTGLSAVACGLSFLGFAIVFLTSPSDATATERRSRIAFSACLMLVFPLFAMLVPLLPGATEKASFYIVNGSESPARIVVNGSTCEVSPQQRHYRFDVTNRFNVRSVLRGREKLGFSIQVFKAGVEGAPIVQANLDKPGVYLVNIGELQVRSNSISYSSEPRMIIGAKDSSKVHGQGVFLISVTYNADRVRFWDIGEQPAGHVRGFADSETVIDFKIVK